MDSFSELLKTYRKEKGLAQWELALETGEEQKSISLYENEVNSPSINKVMKILDAIGYEIKFVKKEK